MTTPTSATIRPGDENEISTIYGLHSEVFGPRSRELLEQRFSWQFVDNPAVGSTSSVHLVAVLDGRIIGALSSFPAKIKLAKRVETILIPCDLLVSPAGRGQGLGQRLLDAHRKTCGALSIALAYTPWTIRFYEKLGYATLPAEPHYYRPVNLAAWSASQVRKRLGDRGELSHIAELAARGAGAVASVALRRVNAFRRPSRSSAYVVRAAGSPDDRFEAMWNRISLSIPACFVRDRTFVDWRYFRDPLSRHTVLVAERGGDPVGFLAYRRIERRGLSVCQLMDVFCDPATPEVARQLVDECLDREETGVDLVVAKGFFPAIRSAVREALYVDKTAHSLPAMLSWQGGSGAPEGLSDAGAWHLSHGDGDEDFLP